MQPPEIRILKESARIDAAACRGARHMLGLSQEQVCTDAGCGRKLLNDFENGLVFPKDSKVAAIKKALELRGAVFLEMPGYIAVAVTADAAAARSPRAEAFFRAARVGED